VRKRETERVSTIKRLKDLCLLSPTAQGLEQSLDLLGQYCQTWALAVNPQKTNNDFQEKIQISGNKTNVFIWYKIY
jgi:hypothetical protein